MTHFRLHPDKRSPFMHRHRRAEELYVILRGSGRIKLDEELFDVQALDAVRVAPEVARAFEAGPEGLEFIAFGPHYDADGEPVDDDWVRPDPGGALQGALAGAFGRLDVLPLEVPYAADGWPVADGAVRAVLVVVVERVWQGFGAVGA